MIQMRVCTVKNALTENVHVTYWQIQLKANLLHKNVWKANVIFSCRDDECITHDFAENISSARSTS